MEFILNKFRQFLEMHKIFHMVERTLDGKTYVDMIIDDPNLRASLLKEKYSSLDLEDGLSELSSENIYNRAKYMKPIVCKPKGRSENCLRINCDKHYASKINKAGCIIMNYHSKNPI